jgi:hypothetical protein
MYRKTTSCDTASAALKSNFSSRLHIGRIRETVLNRCSLQIKAVNYIRGKKRENIDLREEGRGTRERKRLFQDLCVKGEEAQKMTEST